MSKAAVYCSGCSECICDPENDETWFLEDQFGNGQLKFNSDCHCTFCSECFEEISTYSSNNCPECGGDIQHLKEHSVLLCELKPLRLLSRCYGSVNSDLYSAATKRLESLMEDNYKKGKTQIIQI